MNLDIFVRVRTTFIAQHNWPNAPGSVKFLRNMHRHVFHVSVAKKVEHNDRDIEFFTLQKQVKDFVEERFAGRELEGMSCEMMASQILIHFDATSVAVSEDGENEAVVIARPQAVVIARPQEDSVVTKTWSNKWGSYDSGSGSGSGSGIEIENVHVKTKDTTKYGHIFIGLEAEGPWVGRKTMFVPFSTTIDQFEHCYAYCKEHGFEDYLNHIYFGAGNDPILRHLTKELLQKPQLLYHLLTGLLDKRFERVTLEFKEFFKIGILEYRADLITISNESCDSIRHHDNGGPLFYKRVTEDTIRWLNPFSSNTPYLYEYRTKRDFHYFKYDREVAALAAGLVLAPRIA